MTDKTRIEGSAEHAKGSVKKGVGEVTGEEKLKTEGRADRAEGKIQNAVGSAKDKAREAVGEG